MNPSNPESTVPDERGRFGDFGGRFVPETLTKALDELSQQYQQAIQDPTFLPELDALL
ncbi:MAG: tryptophan synthase subunit beta, partial [Planctomycetaceae bacterium]|nr:tryptophan synthase subunit beta [Planctomycetaceae bacterium]